MFNTQATATGMNALWGLNARGKLRLKWRAKKSAIKRATVLLWKFTHFLDTTTTKSGEIKCNDEGRCDDDDDDGGMHRMCVVCVMCMYVRIKFYRFLFHTLHKLNDCVCSTMHIRIITCDMNWNRKDGIKSTWVIPALKISRLIKCLTDASTHWFWVMGATEELFGHCPLWKILKT